MPRQFGLSHREAVGGNQLPGARIAHGTQRELPKSPSEYLQSPIDEREFGSGFLFAFVICAPLIIIGGLVVAYLALVPQSIQY